MSQPQQPAQPADQQPAHQPPQQSPQQAPRYGQPGQPPAGYAAQAPAGYGAPGNASGPGAAGYAAPAGYAPQGYPPAGGPAPVRAPMPKVLVAIWVCAGIAVLGVVLGLTLKENGSNAWDNVNAWGVLPIVGAVLVAAPAFGPALSIPPLRAGQLAVGGAAALVLYWVLFVLPSVGSNTSLLVTVGVAAGVIGAWIAPQRADAVPFAAGGPSGPAGPAGPDGPAGHAW